MPDCPGPRCSGRGLCNVTVDPPRCTGCAAGWMGPACNEACQHGRQTPMDSGRCVCDACYAGRGCDSECSGHGACDEGGAWCECEPGARGAKCELLGCPGNVHDCSLHGSCNSADQTCICLPGTHSTFLFRIYLICRLSVLIKLCLLRIFLHSYLLFLFFSHHVLYFLFYTVAPNLHQIMPSTVNAFLCLNFDNSP